MQKKRLQHNHDVFTIIATNRYPIWTQLENRSAYGIKLKCATSFILIQNIVGILCAHNMIKLKCF